MLFLVGSEPGDDFHLFVVDFEYFSSFIQHNKNLHFIDVVELTDAHVMHEVILFFLLLESDLKLCVLLFLLEI